MKKKEVLEEIKGALKEIESEKKAIEKVGNILISEIKELINKANDFENAVKKAQTTHDVIEILKEWKEFVREHLEKISEVVLHLEKHFI